MKVKLYLPNQHIRRQNLEDCSSFDVIYHHVVENVIGEVPGYSRILLQYLDEEHDWVTVLTEEEWKEAQNCFLSEGDFIRLRARVEKDKKKKKQQKKQNKKAKKKAKKIEKQQSKNDYRSNQVSNDTTTNSTLEKPIEAEPNNDKNNKNNNNDIDVKFRNMMDKALAFIEEEELSNAIETLQNMKQDFPQHNLVYYNLACAYSLKGNVEAAVSNLKEAVSLGYANWEWMLSDPDLAAVRENSESKKELDNLIKCGQKKSDLIYTIDISPNGYCKAYPGLPKVNELDTNDQLANVPEKQTQEENKKTSLETKQEDEKEQQEQQEQEQESSNNEETTLNDKETSKEIDNTNQEDYQNENMENEKYQEQLRLLDEMGFTNSEQNLRLLGDCNGDVARVLAHLVNNNPQY